MRGMETISSNGTMGDLGWDRTHSSGAVGRWVTWDGIGHTLVAYARLAGGTTLQEGAKPPTRGVSPFMLVHAAECALQ